MLTRTERITDGECPACGVGLGRYSRVTEVVECRGCHRAWPSDNWRAAG